MSGGEPGEEDESMWTITNATSGQTLGTYAGATAEEAWEACARAAGYAPGDEMAVRGDDILVEPATTYRYDGTSYATLTAAVEAVRTAHGWADVTTSDEYAIGSQEGRRGSAYAVSCYETQEKCDADQEGAHAPRVEVLRGDWQWALGGES